MLVLNQRFLLREDEVASKVIDGEAIIINLANGIYYSMDKAGALIWEMIQTKHSLEETLTAVTTCYEVSQEDARRDLEQLVEELLKENLVSLSDNSDLALGDSLTHPQEKLRYELPKLNIYRDMGDLLALDPPTPGLGDTPWKDQTEEPSN